LKKKPHQKLGWCGGKGGEMPQTLYAHINKRKKKNWADGVGQGVGLEFKAQYCKKKKFHVDQRANFKI
jgi:hypothetical protein